MQTRPLYPHPTKLLVASPRRNGAGSARFRSEHRPRTAPIPARGLHEMIKKSANDGAGGSDARDGWPSAGPYHAGIAPTGRERPCLKVKPTRCKPTDASGPSDGERRGITNMVWLAFCWCSVRASMLLLKIADVRHAHHATLLQAAS